MMKIAEKIRFFAVACAALGLGIASYIGFV